MPLFKDASGADVEVPTSAEIAEMITGAVRSHVDKANKKLAESLLKEVGESVKKTLDEYEEARASTETEHETEQQQAQSIENDPKFKGLQKQLEELTKQATTARQERDAEKAKQRDIALRQSLSEHLTKSGVDPKYVKHAVGLLVDAEKRVRYTEDGESIAFRDNDGTEIDLPTGLKSWVKSDDAKIYLPPRGASGSGDRPGGRPAAPGASGSTSTSRGEVGRAVLGLIGRMDAESGAGGTQ